MNINANPALPPGIYWWNVGLGSKWPEANILLSLDTSWVWVSAQSTSTSQKGKWGYLQDMDLGFSQLSFGPIKVMNLDQFYSGCHETVFGGAMF